MRKCISSKPKKQRTIQYKGAINLKRKMLGVPLSSSLREKYRVKTIRVKEGDNVRISRGDFSGIDGKVIEVDTERNRLLIEGVTKENVSGTAVRVPTHISNVVITTLNLDDKWRKRRLNDKKEKAK
jgi:large subunit ribosomal protein L24